MTGRAVARGRAYAMSVFGEDVAIDVTTAAAEVELELAALTEHAGGTTALVDRLRRSAAHVGDTHAPDEARVAYQEGLRNLVERR